MIKKIIISIVSLVFIFIIGFVIFFSYQFYKDFKRPKTPTELAEISYYATNHKEINEKFTVDSMSYSVTAFNYYPKKDTTFLYVDVVIENKLNYTKKYTDSFFVLKEGAYKTYYPKMETYYSVFENKTQTLKLQYILPKKTQQSLKYDLHINSKTDTTKDVMVRLYKSYRAEG